MYFKELFIVGEFIMFNPQHQQLHHPLPQLTNISNIVNERVAPLCWGSAPSGLSDQVPLHPRHFLQVVQEQLKHLDGNPRG